MPPTHAVARRSGSPGSSACRRSWSCPRRSGRAARRSRPGARGRSRLSTARTGPPRPSNTLVRALGDDDVAVGVEVRVRGLGVDRHGSVLRRRVYGRAVSDGAPRDGRCPSSRRGVTILPAHVRGDVASCSTASAARRRAPDREYARYGGHSSCVALETDDAAADHLRPRHRPAPVRPSAATGEFHGTVLLSHLHWDHVQGLPFFTPLHREGATLDVYGPRQDDGPLGEVFAEMMRPPFFPITPDQLDRRRALPRHRRRRLPGRSAPRCARVGSATSARRSASASSWNGVSVAYIPDHGPGCSPERRRRLHPARDPRAVRRRRPADPRRAAHARGVRSRSGTGATAPSTTRCTSPASRARGASCSSTTTRRTATTTSTRIERDARPTSSARIGGPR